MNKTQLTCFFLKVNLGQAGTESQTANIAICILNSVFSLATCTGNSIILYVIWKTQELHSPSFILLSCLAAADFLVGLVCQPFFVAYKMAEIANNLSVYCTLRMIYNIPSWITTGVSLVTLSLVSVHQLLALTLHLRYNTIVTVPRVFQISAGVWILSITGITSRFYVRHWLAIPAATLLLTFFVTALSTLKIFQIVRKHQRQISLQEQSVQSNTINMLKCRKSAVTVIYVYGLFVIFYLPFHGMIFVEKFSGYTLTVKIGYDFAATVVFFNSLLNPVVFCWRFGEIRRAVMNTLRKNRISSTENQTYRG